MKNPSNVSQIVLKMNKVCHVLSGFDRYDTRIFSKQCQSLVNEGYDVYILTNDGIPDEEKENIKIISCGPFTKNRFQELVKAKSTFLKKAIEINADIYQLHGPELIPLGLALKKINKKIIYDAHEDLPMQILEKKWIPGILRHPFSKLTEYYLRKNLCKFDEILSVTPHIVDRLKTISDSVTLITNYPIIAKIRSYDYANYIQRDNILCYSGTVYHASNQEFILEAIADIEKVKYHIAGIIDDKFYQKLSKFPAWKKVNYLGTLSRTDIKEFYYKAIAGLIIFDYSPNLGHKRGTLGSNKLFEYMAAGLPIICTDFDLWRNIIDKYKCGIYIQPNNAQQIKDAINLLMNNKEKAYQMGQNAMNAVIQEFNWKTQEQIYLDLFRKYK